MDDLEAEYARNIFHIEKETGASITGDYPHAKYLSLLRELREWRKAQERARK